VRSAKIITAGSQLVCDRIQSRSVKWLPLGIDTRRFQPFSSHRVEKPWRLIQAATLNEVKDQSTLLQALSQVRETQPDVHLHLVGQDILNGRLQRLTSELSLINEVTFHGFMNQKDLLTLYQQAHLYVQSSLFESQGASVLEAAACGVPTVGTAVGLVHELAPDAAVSVPIAHPSAMSAAIIRLLDEEDQRNRLSQAAMIWTRIHNADWTADQFEALYRTAASTA
jgi:glycosyltransferase involved in cell wall biosynthesis